MFVYTTSNVSCAGYHAKKQVYRSRRKKATTGARPDIAALREAIDARLRGRATFSASTYGDQPIVFSGRQLKSFLPEPLAQARALARSPHMLHHSEAYVFWQQARLLATFEDDYEFHGYFSRYFPTYEVMNNEQLRGYFSWRTQWRRGEAVPTETSFLYVCAYELIHCIGVPAARAAYEGLARLRKEYAGDDARMAQNLSRWMDDMVVYWGLPATLLGERAHREQDAALTVLLELDTHDDAELFEALVQLSSYRLGDSALFKTHPDDVRHMVCHIYRMVAAHHDQKLKRSLVQTYFGVSAEQDVELFANAVFADPHRREYDEFEVSPLDHIYCRQGRWSRARYAGNLRPNKKLGALLKTVDATMRGLMGFTPTLEAPLKTKYVLTAIEREAHHLQEQRAKRERRAVHIDRSKLRSIRTAADITRERLIVDEEEEISSPSMTAPLSEVEPRVASPSPVTEPPVVSPLPVTGPPWASPSPVMAPPMPSESDVSSAVSSSAPLLSDDERALLAALLADGDMGKYEREHHVMASLLIESINEKMLDEIGDVVIDTACESPRLFAEYLDEVRGLLHG